MKSKIDNLAKDLKKAFLKLDEVMKKPKDEFIRDSAIQRFEFTYELVWKTLKACLEGKGVKVFSPLDSIKEAFKVGLIDEDEVWMDMLQTRNLTTHTYKESLAEDVYSQLPAYLKLINGLIEKLADQGYIHQ